VVLRHSVELSLNTFFAALSWAKCGEPHLIFAGGERYIPPSAQATVNGEAYEELSNLGLVNGNMLTEDFEHTLHVLNNADHEYFAFTRAGDNSHNLLTAISGKFAVTAGHYRECVWIEPSLRENPAESLITNLPDFPAAQFTAFSLTQKEWHDLHADQNPDQNRYSPTPVPTRAARKLQAFTQQDCHGLAEIHSSHRKSNGGKEHATNSLAYLDTDAGRVGIQTTGRENNKYINVFPGEPRQLMNRLTGTR
jgi:hypothetical protein